MVTVDNYATCNFKSQLTPGLD